MKPKDTTYAISLAMGLLLALLGLAPVAHAQITINRADIEAFVGQTFSVQTYDTEATSELQTIVDATGEAQTYDFSSINFELAEEGTFSYQSMPADVPGADDPDFSEATFVQAIDLEAETASETDSTAWLFERLEDDGLYAMGAFFVSQEDIDQDGSSPDSIKLVFDPSFRQLALPLSLGTAWTAETSFNVVFSGVTVTIEMTIENEVEGYGTLMTPAGEESALRMHSTETTSFFGTTSTTQSLSFITKGALSATIDLDENGDPMGASYQVQSSEGGTPIEHVEADVPTAYRLEQNYPNPFNPATVIRYDVPQTQHVTLTVHDMLGREVATLVDRAQAAGRYSVSFEARDLPSGMYLYRLRAGSHVETRTMTLVR